MTRSSCRLSCSPWKEIHGPFINKAVNSLSNEQAMSRNFSQLFYSDLHWSCSQTSLFPEMKSFKRLLALMPDIIFSIHVFLIPDTRYLVSQLLKYSETQPEFVILLFLSLTYIDFLFSKNKIRPNLPALIQIDPNHYTC